MTLEEMEKRKLLSAVEVDEILDVFLEVQLCLELVSQRIDRVLQSKTGAEAIRMLLELLVEIRQRMMPDLRMCCRSLSRAA